MTGMIIDIAGKKFGRLAAQNCVGRNKHGAAVWSCLCDCGNQYEVVSHDLRKGHTQSCGCLRKEVAAKTNLVHGHTAYKGLRKSSTYTVWQNMISRCYNSRAGSYPNYGGKGITVCDRWRSSFINFLSDMGERPESLSIDRKDSGGNYEPGNCRWADDKIQANNKGMQKNNTSGYKNVHWRKNRWVVVFKPDGKMNYFGSFIDVHEAGRKADEVRRGLA